MREKRREREQSELFFFSFSFALSPSASSRAALLLQFLSDTRHHTPLVKKKRNEKKRKKTHFVFLFSLFSTRSLLHSLSSPHQKHNKNTPSLCVLSQKNAGSRALPPVWLQEPRLEALPQGRRRADQGPAAAERGPQEQGGERRGFSLVKSVFFHHPPNQCLFTTLTRLFSSLFPAFYSQNSHRSSCRMTETLS